ncbi:hypothetical protein D9M71_202990 [compost metagenome]
MVPAAGSARHPAAPVAPPTGPAPAHAKQHRPAFAQTPDSHANAPATGAAPACTQRLADTRWPGCRRPDLAAGPPALPGKPGRVTDGPGPVTVDGRHRPAAQPPGSRQTQGARPDHPPARHARRPAGLCRQRSSGTAAQRRPGVARQLPASLGHVSDRQTRQGRIGCDRASQAPVGCRAGTRHPGIAHRWRRRQAVRADRQKP